MLFPLFKQISGVLVMLEYERANALLVACRNRIEEFSRSDYEHKQSEQVRLAEGLSSIGFFIEALKYEQHDRINIVEAAINQFGSDVVTAAVPPPVPKSVPTASDRLATSVPSVLPDLPTVQMVETATSQETSPGTQEALLATFLEESTEVLASIATRTQACRNNPSDYDSLITIRRGFHTLKGSGRIVGLLKIAEVAWNMEQILSRWLNEGKPVTNELLDLIANVHQEFCGWCESLKEKSAIQLSTDELQVSTERLASSAEPETETEVVDTDLDAQTASATTVPETVAETKPNIVIGDAVISPELFEVFTTEVKQHLATLEGELDSLIGRPDKPVSHEFMLAAHTLASISRNLKLEFIADIGHVLEQLLTFLSKKSTQPDQVGLQLLRNVIELLGRMLGAICSQRLPDQVDLQAGVTLSHEMALMPRRTEKASEAEHAKLQEIEKPGTFVSSQNEWYSIRDDIDPDLLETFMEETQELIPSIGSELRYWRTDPKDENFRKALLRALHTLKGSARIAGAMSLGELVHNMESCVEAAPKESELSALFFDSLETELDRISEKIEHLQSPPKDGIKAVEEKIAEEPITPVSSPETTTLQPNRAEETLSGQPEEIGIPLQKTLLRVHTELIDHLVNESGEVSNARS